MVSGGSIETRGEVLWPSTSTRLASSKLQPSKISSCTVTGSGEDSSLKRCGSKVATRCKLSMEMASFRADCWRRAFKNTSGRKKSLRLTGWLVTSLEFTRRIQSPLRATIRLARPCRYSEGSSGAEGQVAAQLCGTSPRISALACTCRSGVLRALPLTTRCSVDSALVTSSPRRCASAASIKMNATVGGSSGITARISTPRSLLSWPLLTFSQMVKSGASCALQTFMSTWPAAAAPSPWPAASCRSNEMALAELMRCRDRSALGAMPKDAGLSRSGSCSTLARKSAMLVEAGRSKAGISTPVFRLPPSRVSLLKNIVRYSCTRRESNSLSTRLPYTASSRTPMSVTQSIPADPGFALLPASPAFTSSDTVSQALCRSLWENS
mmetsp:Transcript_20852/g.49506  ORF Transcript_20852/g.49506 Transcript_20852/m.49506 type:complete len:382 (-) Transcript_20852:830-1975(-)